MERLVWATGLAALLTIAWAAAMFVHAGNPHLMEVQLDANPAVVESVRMDASKLDKARDALHMDFLLLGLYGSTLALLGILLFRRPIPHRRLLGGAAIAFAVLTAGFDVLENRVSLSVLPQRGSGDISQSTLDWLQRLSYAKWAMSVVTVALLTRVFVGRDGGLVGRGRAVVIGRGRVRLLVQVMAGLMAIAVVVGVLGLVASWPEALAAYFLLLGVVLFLVIWQSAFTADRFLRGY
jgi:hypothetical protein